MKETLHTMLLLQVKTRKQKVFKACSKFSN